MLDILKNVRQKLEKEEYEIKEWLRGDQTFEKLGEIMSQNDCKMLGLYTMNLQIGCHKLTLYTAVQRGYLIHMSLQNCWNYSVPQHGQEKQVSSVYTSCTIILRLCISS